MFNCCHTKMLFFEHQTAGTHTVRCVKSKSVINLRNSFRREYHTHLRKACHLIMLTVIPICKSFVIEKRCARQNTTIATALVVVSCIFHSAMRYFALPLRLSALRSASRFYQHPPIETAGTSEKIIIIISKKSSHTSWKVEHSERHHPEGKVIFISECIALRSR